MMTCVEQGKELESREFDMRMRYSQDWGTIQVCLKPTLYNPSVR